MSAAAALLPLRRGDAARWSFTALLFAVLFWQPFSSLVRDWWIEPSASHALLLVPIALVLGWRRGLAPNARPQPVLGSALLALAIGMRFAAGLAAEVFTMRLSFLLAIVALVVFAFGLKQIRHWWLPALLLLLSVPIPPVLLASIALPLQLQASRIGAALLEARYVPVRLAGNVIHLPGQSLFVTEACSGLRSLTALLSIAVLLAGTMLQSVPLRTLLITIAIPIAVVLNGLRIFITGFLVYHVDPKLGQGFLHLSEGWLLFVVALVLLGLVAVVLARVERRRSRRASEA